MEVKFKPKFFSRDPYTQMPSPLNVEKFYPNVENFDQYIENFDQSFERSNENDKNLYKIIDEAELDLYEGYNVDPIIEVLP